MKKRILSFMMVVALFLTLVVPVSSVEAPTIILTNSVTDVQRGATVEIKIDIRNNPGISSLSVKLNYDTSILHLEKISKGELFDSVTSNTSTGRIVCDSGEDVCEDGTLATAYFKVLEDAAPSEYVINATVVSCNNFDEQRVSCSTVPASVTVACNHVYSAWENSDSNTHKRTCSICGKVETAAHSWDAGKVTTEPTHLAEGEKTYTCTVCGASRIEKIKPTPEHSYGTWEKHNDTQHKHTCACGAVEYENHKWNAGEVTKAPTCKDTGIKTYTCTVCGETKTETLPIIDTHTWGEWTKDTADEHKRICSICGKSETAAHSWDEGRETKPATHLTEGEKTYTCTVCGATKIEKIKPTDEHSFGVWEKHNETQHKHTCACGAVEYENHKWNAGEVTKAPTCKDTGIKTYTCTVCGETKMETLPLIDTHTWGEWTKDTADEHKRICSICGKSETAAHSWDEGKVTTEPTHLAEGVKTYTCEVCEETRTESIPKTTEHSFGVWEKHNETQHKHTCACGAVEYEDHKWNAGEVTTEPTCKDTGIKTYTCTVCGETKTEMLPIIDTHTWGEWTKDTAEAHKRTCSICGKAETAAHSWDEGKITTEPTHLTEGVKTYTCEVCGETRTESIPKTTEHSFGAWEKHNEAQHKHTCACGAVEYENHKWNAGEVTKAPTCKDTGIKTYTCTVCGETKTETLPIIDTHTWGEWTKLDETNHTHTCTVCGKSETAAHAWDEVKVTKPATHLAEGEKTYTCTVCGATKIEKIKPTDEHSFGAWEKHNETQHKHTCACGAVEYEDHKWNAGEVTKAPTCKDTGIKTYTCTVCGETKTETLPLIDTHTWGEWTKGTADEHKRICSICGKSETAAHSWDEGKITTEPTHLTEGEKTYTCEVCEETRTEVIAKLPVTEDTPCILIGTGTAVAGDTVQIIISLKNNPGFIGMNMYLIYSEELTLLQAVNKADNLTFTMDKTLVWDGGENYAQDGDLLILTFKVNDDAKSGDYEINLVINEAFNNEEQDVFFYTVQGMIHVVDCVYGDANGDGVINTKDIVLVRKYVAGKDPVTGVSNIEVTHGADVNGDGVVNTRDVVLLRKYVAGVDPSTGKSDVVLGPTK